MAPFPQSYTWFNKTRPEGSDSFTGFTDDRILEVMAIKARGLNI